MQGAALCTLIGPGLQVPEPSDLDLWGYSDTTGLTREPEQSSSA
jgi:hypothetical protein